VRRIFVADLAEQIAIFISKIREEKPCAATTSPIV
jgi:hypothetical protein